MGWSERFPWCRTTEQDAAGLPPHFGNAGAYAIGSPLRSGYVILDDWEFIKFLEREWLLDVGRDDLNLLEYHGLVIPPMKAITDSLRRRSYSESLAAGTRRHSSDQQWVYRRIGKTTGSKKRVPKTVRVLRYDRLAELERVPAHLLNAMPWLSCEYRSSFVPAPPRDSPPPAMQIVTPVPPPKEPDVYAPSKLLEMKLLLNPTQPQYWAALGRSGMKAPDAPASRVPAAASWISELLGGNQATVLRLTDSAAEWGNEGVTRFYIVGCAFGENSRRRGSRRRALPSHPLGLGQDWHVASVLTRLRCRADLKTVMKIEAAVQRQVLKRSLLALQAATDAWERLARREELKLPDLHPHFFRNTLLWTLHNSRPKDVAPDASLQALAEVTDLKKLVVRKELYKGRGWLQ
jgi:hypothetical protein